MKRQEVVTLRGYDGEYSNFMQYGLKAKLSQGWILAFVLINDQINQMATLVFELDSPEMAQPYGTGPF